MITYALWIIVIESTWHDPVNNLCTTVGYNNKPKTIALTPSRKRLGKHLADGNSLSVAVECVKDKPIQKHVISAVGQVIRNKVYYVPTELILFRDVKSLQDFSWDTIVDEATQQAPNLFNF